MLSYKRENNLSYGFIVPAEHRVEIKKKRKYKQILEPCQRTAKTNKLGNMRVIGVRIVVGALFEKRLEDCKFVEESKPEKTAFLGSGRILRSVSETGDLVPPRFH